MVKTLESFKFELAYLQAILRLVFFIKIIKYEKKTQVCIH